MDDYSPPFSLFGDSNDDDSDNDGYSALHSDIPANEGQVDFLTDETNLQTVMERIGRQLPTTAASSQDERSVVAEMNYRIDLIKRHMGSLALCRGIRGDMLHKAGAIETCVEILAILNTSNGADGTHDGSGDVVRLPVITASTSKNQNEHESNGQDDAMTWSELDQVTVSLASACMCAIRDLACGNASNRSAITEHKCGPQTLASYVQRYHGMAWEDILYLPENNEQSSSPSAQSNENDSNHYTARGRKELRLFTDSVGAIRNATHSTPKTCKALHHESVTELLIWRLKYGSREDADDGDNVVTLPDAKQPWREASFRIAGSLINLSEKCNDAARRCGLDLAIIDLLIEAWGGGSAKKQSPASTPLLHLGLAAILHAADEHLKNSGQGGLDERLKSILDKEDKRKEYAQKKEAERKERIARGLK